jgi:hypothetical protein
LRLSEIHKREVTTADGRKHLCPYVGPLHVSFEGRSCFAGALVIGQGVLLGSVPIDDMDLVISPADRKLRPNPENPNIPGAIVMRLQ